MKKPYVICHMMTSLDGKVTGDFLTAPEQEKAADIYYEINRAYGADGYACGRVTMEGSFTGGWRPDLSPYDPSAEDWDREEDFVRKDPSGFYAVAFDPHGVLGWKSNHIRDPQEDPGYHNARIVEILTRQADPKYVAYLRDREIFYLFAGEREVDAALGLQKLSEKLGIQKLLLEGGSVLNGAFMEADLIDEISLVVCPAVADTRDKPLFAKSSMAAFALAQVKQWDEGVLWLNYKRNNGNEIHE